MAAALVVAGAALPGLADEIKIGGIQYKHVKVVGMRDGKLYFESPAGERSASLAEVESIKLDKWPELSQADEALDKKDYAGAANLLSGLLEKVNDDYLKVLVSAKLVFALDRSGQFLAAARHYAQLLTIESGPLAQAVVPQGLPTDPAARAKAAEELGADLKSTSDPFARQYLEKVVKDLGQAGAMPANPAAPGANPNPAAPAAPRLGGLVGGEAEARRDLVAEMIKAGQYDQALKAADAALAAGGDLSKLLYQRGQVLEHIDKQEMEAVVSYMRVVIHFPRSSYAAPSLIGAGKMLKKLGKTEEATKLLNEARTASQNNPERLKEIDAILGSSR